MQVFEAGEAGGVTFLAMEWLPGADLHAKLAAGPLPARAAAALVAALADGVAHAHAAGVLHRDLKPANVLLAEGGAPKLADFGLAAPLAGGTGLTATGEVVGTPSYMAPEAVDGEAGPAGDVYGLGAVLYECLTGRAPFAGSNFAVTLMQVRSADPVSPRVLNPEVPRDLDTICLKCLEKRPGKRYPTAAALAADLQAFLAGRPVAARPPGPLGHAAKWVRRRPAAAAGVLGATLVLLAGLGGWARHTRQLAVALEAERQAVALADQRRDHLAGVVTVLKGVFADLDVSRLRDDNVSLERALADRLVAASAQLAADDLGDSVQLASLRERLASTVSHLGYPAKAIPLYQAAADAYAAHPNYGPDHDETLNVRDNLASAYNQISRPDLALPPLRDIHARRVRTLGPDAPRTLFTQHHLEAALAAAGRPDEAKAVNDDLHPRATKTFGPDHQLTIETEAAFIRGRPNDPAWQAERFAALAGRCRRVLGDANPHTVGVRSSHAIYLVASGRVAEALPLYQALSTEADAAGGPDREDAIQAKCGLAWALDKAGRQPEAAAAYADAVARIERQEFQPRISKGVVRDAAKHAEKHGRHAVAESWRREWSAAAKGRDDGSDAYALSLGALGANLLVQKKYAEAEAVLLSAHAEWAKRPNAGKEPGWVADRLAELYVAQKRSEDARKWRELGSAHPRPDGSERGLGLTPSSK